MRNSKIVVLLLAVTVGFLGCSKESANAIRGAGTPVLMENPEQNSSQGDGTSVGNGGGAIYRDGNLLTWAQAGVNVNVELEDTTDDSAGIVEIPIVESTINRLAISYANRASLLRSLMPSPERKYFKIKSSDLDPEKKKKLLAAYYAAIGEQVPTADITLVALTIKKETFLLPEFYQLSDSSARAAILFHEALWVKNPKLKLSSILQAEVGFENLLRSPAAKDKLIYSPDVFTSLKEALQDDLLGLVGAVRKDLYDHPKLSIKLPTTLGQYTNKVLTSPKLTLNDLIGEAAMNALNETLFLDPNLVYAYIYDLKRANPKVLFISELEKLLPKMRVYLIAQEKQSLLGTIVLPFPIVNDMVNELWVIGSAFGKEIIDLSAPGDLDFMCPNEIYPSYFGPTEDELGNNLVVSKDECTYNGFFGAGGSVGRSLAYDEGIATNVHLILSFSSPFKYMEKY